MIIQAILSGSVIAIVITNILNYIKKEKEINTIKNSFISITDSIIIPQLNKIASTEDIVLESFKENTVTYIYPSATYRVDDNFLQFFNTKDLLIVFKKYNIESYYLYHISVGLNHLINNRDINFRKNSRKNNLNEELDIDDMEYLNMQVTSYFQILNETLDSLILVNSILKDKKVS